VAIRGRKNATILPSNGPSVIFSSFFFVSVICIIGHGGSSPEAVRNAIRVAGECVEFGLNEKIMAKIKEAEELFASDVENNQQQDA
jgi:hypothetical protein